EQKLVAVRCVPPVQDSPEVIANDEPLALLYLTGPAIHESLVHGYRNPAGLAQVQAVRKALRSPLPVVDDRFESQLVPRPLGKGRLERARRRPLVDLVRLPLVRQLDERPPLLRTRAKSVECPLHIMDVGAHIADSVATCLTQPGRGVR